MTVRTGTDPTGIAPTGTDPTGTSPPSVASRPTRIAVDRDGGTHRWRLLDQGDHLAPRPVWADRGSARVALVGIAMMLLGGDRVEVEVEVGPGAVLEIVEPAALLALDAGGEPSSWRLRATLGEGAVLLYDGAPLIVASGARVRRDLRVHCAAGCRVLLRETQVLGRSGEAGGELSAGCTVSDPGGELFVDRLEAGTAVGALPALLGRQRVLDQVIAVGWLPADRDAAVLVTEAPGAVLRELADEADTVAARVSAAYRSWRGELLD